MARTYSDVTFTLPDSTTTTLRRNSDQYIRLKRTLYKIRQRCNNPNDNAYHNYGGRGIRCYINSIDEIVQTIGLKPKGYSIDRIDNNGDYTLDNIRWADPSTQQRNVAGTTAQRDLQSQATGPSFFSKMGSKIKNWWKKSRLNPWNVDLPKKE